MSLENAFVPYGAYWSTPFCRWQGSLSQLNAIELAARVTAGALEVRQISPEALDSLVLGYTVPQRHSFYGSPWLAGMIGAPGISGPMVSQACSTSARTLIIAALEVETGQRRCVLGVTCDRTSNGPHIYYPDPGGTGGTGKAEDPVWDNFNRDPWAKQAMIQTAENVAAEAGITREEQDEVTLLRHKQYTDALADDRAFQRRYMHSAEIPKGKKKTVTIEADEGVFPTTVEGLGRLRPVLEGGTVTYGTQTFPADGNAGMVVCTRELAQQLSPQAQVTVQVLSYGDVRVKPAFMPTATVPAARQALEGAGIGIGDCKVIKTHNPFAVNDVYLCRELGLSAEAINPYGSPLIYGHPQGPTGMRVIIEMIEALVDLGGGHGLFTGCAAGDTAMSVVVKVS
jgi:acetyl-CoA acetyltransferase family protein